jgi:hypothetical protein
VLPDELDDGLEANWHVIQSILDQAPDPLTRHQIHANWPTDLRRPTLITLYRWLQNALASNLVASHGTGRRTDPFRYALIEENVDDVA